MAYRPRNSKSTDEPTYTPMDAGIIGLTQGMIAGDLVWFHGSKFTETHTGATLTAPTLGFAEEIKTRFGNQIASRLKKTVTYAWLEDGPKAACKIEHGKRLDKLNPHNQGYERSCNCHQCAMLAERIKRQTQAQQTYEDIPW